MKVVRREFWKNVLPSMIAFAFTGVYAIVDGFFVGRNVGDAGLAAINMAYPLVALIQAAGLGLGMAGAFPTTTAFTGDLMGNSPLGMSVFTGIGSLGGILTPQVIGVLADKLGFQAAILFLVLDAFLLALFGAGALRYATNQKIQVERP